MSHAPSHATSGRSVSAPEPPAEVLIVDNDQAHAETVAESLEPRRLPLPRGHLAAPKGPGSSKKKTIDVIITDLVMNDIDGLEILARAKSDQPDAEVILITGHGTVPSAVDGHAAGGLQLPAQAVGPGQLRAVTEKAADSCPAAADQRRTASAGWTSASASRG